jgi:hypothetical protein
MCTHRHAKVNIVRVVTAQLLAMMDGQASSEERASRWRAVPMCVVIQEHCKEKGRGRARVSIASECTCLISAYMRAVVQEHCKNAWSEDHATLSVLEQELMCHPLAYGTVVVQKHFKRVTANAHVESASKGTCMSHQCKRLAVTSEHCKRTTAKESSC